MPEQSAKTSHEIFFCRKRFLRAQCPQDSGVSRFQIGRNSWEMLDAYWGGARP